jgi:hypothetical protein
MAVTVFCDDPPGLLRGIRSAIIEGHVTTWSVDQDGDFTHTPEQWKNHAWLRPRFESDRVIFNIVPPRKRPITKGDYAIYHGRFIEMLLAHFDTSFQVARATAMPALGDKVG